MDTAVQASSETAVMIPRTLRECETAHDATTSAAPHCSEDGAAAPSGDNSAARSGGRSAQAPGGTTSHPDASANGPHRDQTGAVPAGGKPPGRAHGAPATKGNGRGGGPPHEPPAGDHDRWQQGVSENGTTALELAGFRLEGVSVGGQETSISIPSLNVAFDIGRCPQRSVFQRNLLISHAHMDHIGGIAFHIATRGLLALSPPTVVVPSVNRAAVDRLIQTFRELDGSELQHELVGMGVGETRRLSNSHYIKAFRTYHVVPSQGYLIYSTKRKLKEEYKGLAGDTIRALKMSGTEVTDSVDVPEVAFTGDTTAEFITDPENADVLRAKLLIMEVTFLDDQASVEHARRWGHTHISEVAELAHRFQNQAILFIHFSARYRRHDIFEALTKLPPELRDRVTPLLERF